jgi:hypothetical protein
MRQLKSSLRPQEARELDRRLLQSAVVLSKAKDLQLVSDQLQARGVVASGPDGELRFAKLGHPFEASDESALLIDYVRLAKSLNASLSAETQAPSECPIPLCNETVFRVGVVIGNQTMHEAGGKPVQWAAPVPPDPYIFESFANRFRGDPVVVAQLELNFADYGFLQRGSQLAPRLAGQNLVFDRGLTGSRVLITQWSSKDPYPRVLPIYWALIEAENVRRLALEVDSRLTIEEIRLEAHKPGSAFVVVERGGQGLKLHIKALRTNGKLSVSEVRREIEQQLRAGLSASY